MDLVILDEINYAIGYKMLDPAKVLWLRSARSLRWSTSSLPDAMRTPGIVEIPDTVTEMKEVKHAYEKGILAQRGIEF